MPSKTLLFIGSILFFTLLLGKSPQNYNITKLSFSNEEPSLSTIYFHTQEAVQETPEQTYSNTDSNPNIVFKEPDNKIQKNFINWMFILNGFLGLFIALRILLKNRRTDFKNVYFSIFISGVSLMLVELAFFWWEGFAYNPKVSFFRAQFYFWIPSLYLYLRNKIKIAPRVNKQEIFFHYLIPVVLLFFYILIHFDTSNFFVITLNSLTLKTIHTGVYILLLIYTGIIHQEHIQTINKKWLITLISFTSVIFILLIIRTYFKDDQIINSLTIYFTAIFFSIFINIISFIVFLEPEIIVSKTEVINGKQKKYKNSGLTEDMLHSLKTQLEALLTKQKIYLDNTLTLESIATKLNTDRYSLSQTINQEFGKNYYELINDYRVAEAVHIIHNSESEILITDLIYECGFNNKVSFYKAFKKRHNKTPLEYQKMARKNIQNKS
ncbi:helix-turn-helix domain-containing protein [Cellulophaga baltica]|uniref:helix-turn-helix domain-containing protein n=1 Tax=Cellulophaga baltica TaxID=76594 RepID=UPI000418FDC6|nr:AraC family transcriptional regulator [Cellulophaga baltica]AIY15149.1 hypothetical protein M667_19405 [Cellulophaga baltica NN016038]